MPHQVIGTQFIESYYVSDKAGCLIAAETGCGKSLMVLDFLAAHRDKRTLVVVPAIARGEWLRQNTLHLEEPLALTSADTGPKVAAWCAENTSGVLTTSYHLLKHVTGDFDIVINDECQMISNPEVAMTREVGRICGESTLAVCLSGTPALDRPDQFWSVLHLIQPSVWGKSIWSFRRRYCEAVPNEWAPSGVVYKGLRPDRAVELSQRLKSVMYRVRKSDIADTLPPLTISMRYVKAKRSKLDWDDEASFESLLALNSSQKLDTVLEIIEQARLAGEARFVVFTYLRATADECGARFLAAGYHTEVVTGATPADARHAPIERIRTSERPAVLVCNIDAVGVSLDFTFSQTAVFAEQHWVPGKTLQAIGRLQRLSSRHAAQCIFVVVEGTKEQRQAETFCRKQSELNAILPAGRDETSAVEALNREESDDSILRGL